MIKFENGAFLLKNELFSRTLVLDQDGVRTTSCRLAEGDLEYVFLDTPPEFSFKINDEGFSGYAPGEQKLKFRDYSVDKGAFDAEILNITFDLPGEGQGSVTLTHIIYPDLPGTIRKISFAADAQDLKITELVLETFNLAPRDSVNCQIYREQGTVPALAQFTITGMDDMLRIHDAGAKAGFFTGSSIPGPLRYVMCYPHWATGIRCGYSQSSPVFCKYLAPGETWCSDELFLILYSGELEDPRGRNDFRELVRRTMPELSPVAGPMYCTWIPFLTNISEELVSEVAKAAGESGFNILVLDDGWFKDGQWQIDEAKFPNGLEKVAESVRSQGLKFGLWFNIGTDYGSAGSTPENNCILPGGAVKKSGKAGVRCFASAHREKVAEKLQSLARQYGLAYFKMDFSNIISPYGVLPVGCSSHDHAWHRDSDDAVLEQYRSLYQLRKTLKETDPDLCLDYSFEVFGTEFPGVAGLQFSDIQHVSNLHLTDRFYDARIIRETLYAFTAMLPPERVSGALLELMTGQVLETIMTAMVGNPLMAGDLRLLTPEERRTAKRVFSSFERISAAGALTDMQTWKWESPDHDPAGAADGYFRWSRKTGDGIAAFFANKSGAESVTVKFPVTDGEKRLLTDIVSGETIGTFTASELQKGITIPFSNSDVRGFTVEKSKI